MWITILVFFTSVSMLLFGQLPVFQDFIQVLIFYYESALGSWDTSPYCDIIEFSGEADDFLCTFGIIYTVLFLLVNLVLVLNLVIALLSSIFAYYEDKTLGLYYEVIVALFPSMEYDDKYGAVVCA